MKSYCVGCGVESEEYCLVLGDDWLDFCKPCANTKYVTNSLTGANVKVIDLIEGNKTGILSDEWCDCDEPTFYSYPKDDECICGLYKHHVHCTCGNIMQVG